jgi:hypothetical protein
MGAKSKCGKCLNVFYCNRDCQTKDWKSHKEVCGKSEEDLIMESRKSESVSHSSLDSMTSLMKVMMLGSNSPKTSEMLKMMAIYERAPDLASEFKEYLRHRKNTDISLGKVMDLLKQETADSRALYMHEMLFYENAGSPGHPRLKDPHTLVKLTHSCDQDKILWYLNAPIGDVYVAKKMTDSYQDVFHSFSNCLPNLVPFYPGQTLVAIGYVDLSILLHGTFIEPDVKDPFHFIGYEGCAFNVAKTLVIQSMLTLDDEHIVDAILQVWYSSCWSEPTLKHFKASLDEAIKNCSDMDVLEILGYWKNVEPPSIKVARDEWLSKISSGSLGPASNCLTESRNSLTFYFITGQLLDASVGSVVMFQLPEHLKFKRSIDESVFHSLDLKTMVFHAKQNGGDFVKGAVSILRVAIGELNKKVRTGSISIKIVSPTFISINNTKVVKEISSLKPHWISWNNCLDYMTIADFHRLARSCSGPSDTIHFGYSMNWVTNVARNSFFAMPVGEHNKEWMERARAAIALTYGFIGASSILIKPPITNPVNVLDYALRMKTYHDWAKVFFEDVPKVIKVEKGKGYYNVFHKTSDVINMVWTYDENVIVSYHN